MKSSLTHTCKLRNSTTYTCTKDVHVRKYNEHAAPACLQEKNLSFHVQVLVSCQNIQSITYMYNHCIIHNQITPRLLNRYFMQSLQNHTQLPINSAGLFGLLLINASKASYNESTNQCNQKMTSSGPMYFTSLMCYFCTQLNEVKCKKESKSSFHS